MPDSESARVRTVAFAGRSSDLLLSGRLPVVHRHDSGRSIVRRCAMKLTAAGLSGIFTRFPFIPRPERQRENQQSQR